MKIQKNEKSTPPKSNRKRSAKPTAIAATAAAREVVSTSNAAPVRQTEAPTFAPPPPAASLLQSYTEQLRTGELATRIEAAARLAEIGDPQAAGALQQALRDPTAEVACEAATALAKSRSSTAVDALSAVIENADNYFHYTVRAAAAASLAQLNDPRAIKALSTAVRDPFAEPSRAAIRALGAVAREEAVPTLLGVISNGDNYFLPSVRVAATEVLATIPAPEARNYLRDLMNNPNEVPEIRQVATQAFA
jgi:HEAT repeat protein